MTSVRHHIFVVDDHPIVCQGLTILFDNTPDLRVCGQATNEHKAVELIEQLRPELVIVDISLGGGGCRGLELVQSLVQTEPKLKLVVFSMHDERIYAERAIRAGARGYVMKHAAPDSLVHAVRVVLGNSIYLSPSVAETVMFRYFRGDAVQSSLVDALSNRELEVFQMLGQGFSTKQIAVQLHLSVKTIESHRAHIKEKLGARSSNEMLCQAVEWVLSHSGAA